MKSLMKFKNVTRRRRLRGVHVGVRVNPQEAHLGGVVTLPVDVRLGVPKDGPEADGMVAADRDTNAAGTNDLTHLVGKLKKIKHFRSIVFLQGTYTRLLLLFIFGLFKQTYNFIQQYNVKKCPSSTV